MKVTFWLHLWTLISTYEIWVLLKNYHCYARFSNYLMTVCMVFQLWPPFYCDANYRRILCSTMLIKRRASNVQDWRSLKSLSCHLDHLWNYYNISSAASIDKKNYISCSVTQIWDIQGIQVSSESLNNENIQKHSIIVTFKLFILWID